MSTHSEAESKLDTVSAGTSQVTLVIPGRNCASTLERCLDSVVPLKESGQLLEIIFVNDGSTDDTAEIAARYPVQVIQGAGQGPGAARNLGWKSTDSDLIWFIDSDCVAEPDALEILIPRMNESEIAGVGGSYANLFPDSLVASLIHEEIVARHRRMESEVDFLATFNVLYRRDALEETGGFNEQLKLAQDAELAYRMRAAGHRLGFEIESRVGHHHPRNFWRYLRTQARQGYYRVQLYRQHTTKMSGDSYAGILDYLQPPLACLSWGMFVLALFQPLVLVGAFCISGVLLLLQIPMMYRCSVGLGIRSLAFLPFGFIRSHARAVGMSLGALSVFQSASSGESNQQNTPLPDDDGSAPDVCGVSVIVPSRNRRRKLIRLLESLEKQTVAGFEVLVVDDGSTDDTQLHLEAYAEKTLPYSLKLIKHEKPRGANPARNLAIERSRGEWIAMLDDDCFAEPTWLENMAVARDRHNAVAVTGYVENVALSNQWERFFVGQHRVTSNIRDGRPVARRLVAGNALVRRDWLVGTLDVDRSSVESQVETSGRGDEEGLRLAIIRGGELIIHAEDAVVFHDHPYRFPSFCRQAFKSGRSTARLASKYRLLPRWELLALLLTPLFLALSLLSRGLGLAAAALSFSFFFSAVIYNELRLKRKTVVAVLATLPALVIYCSLRTLGYSIGLALSPFRAVKPPSNNIGGTGIVQSETKVQ